MNAGIFSVDVCCHPCVFAVVGAFVVGCLVVAWNNTMRKPPESRP